MPTWLQGAAAVGGRLIVVAAALGLVVYATTRVQLLFVALFVALFIALILTSLLRPVVDTLDKVMPRPLATALALLAGVGSLGGLLTYVGYSVTTQWASLRGQISRGISQLTDLAQNGPLPIHVSASQVTDAITSAEKWAQGHSGQLASQAAAGAGSAVEALTCLSLAVFLTVFFLATGSPMWAWFIGQLPAAARAMWQDGAGAAWHTFSAYSRGTVMVAFTDALLAFALLSVVRVPSRCPWRCSCSSARSSPSSVRPWQ